MKNSTKKRRTRAQKIRSSERRKAVLDKVVSHTKPEVGKVAPVDRKSDITVTHTSPIAAGNRQAPVLNFNGCTFNITRGGGAPAVSWTDRFLQRGFWVKTIVCGGGGGGIYLFWEWIKGFFD